MAKKQKQLWQRRIKRFKKRLHLLLVPQRDNYYRPHLVRRYGLLVVLALAIGLQFGHNYTQTGSVLGRVTSVTPAALLASTNEQRLAAGLAGLNLDSQLNQAAKQKAEDMLARNYWSHDAPDGTEPWVWIDKSGYNYVRAGENLAKNFSSADATMAAWMNSESHRQNVLSDNYSDVGFASVNGQLDGQPATVTVAFYGTKKQDAAVAGATSDRSVAEAPVNASISPATRIGMALLSLTPAAVTSLALLFVAVTVSLTAHIYRSKLPKNRRQTWYKQHGAIKATGLLSIAAFIVLIYGGGQI